MQFVWHTRLVVHEQQAGLKVVLQARLELSIVRVAVKDGHLQHHLIPQAAQLHGHVRGALNDLHPDHRLTFGLQHIIDEVLLVEIDCAPPAGIVLAQLTAWQQASKRPAISTGVNT